MFCKIRDKRLEIGLFNAEYFCNSGDTKPTSWTEHEKNAKGEDVTVTKTFGNGDVCYEANIAGEASKMYFFDATISQWVEFNPNAG